MNLLRSFSKTIDQLESQSNANLHALRHLGNDLFGRTDSTDIGSKASSLPTYLDEELRLKGLRHFVNPASTKEKIILEVYQNEKLHPVLRNWGQAYGMYLHRLLDRAPYTFVDPAFDNRSIRRQPEYIRPLEGFVWQDDWLPEVRPGFTDENGYQYAETWGELTDSTGSPKCDQNCSVRRRLLRRCMVPADENSLPSLPYSVVIRVRCATSSAEFERRFFRNSFHVEIHHNGQYIGRTPSQKPEWNTLFTIPMISIEDQSTFRFSLFMDKLFRMPRLPSSTSQDSSQGPDDDNYSERSTSQAIILNPPLNTAPPSFPFLRRVSLGGRSSEEQDGEHDRRAEAPGDPALFQLIGSASLRVQDIRSKRYDKLPEFTLALFYPDDQSVDHRERSGNITLEVKFQENILFHIRRNPSLSLQGRSTALPLSLSSSPGLSGSSMPMKFEDLKEVFLTLFPSSLQETIRFFFANALVPDYEAIFQFYSNYHLYLTSSDLLDVHANLLHLLSFHQQKMEFMTRLPLPPPSPSSSSSAPAATAASPSSQVVGHSLSNLPLRNKLLEERSRENLLFPHQKLFYSTIYSLEPFFQWKDGEKEQRRFYSQVSGRYQEMIASSNAALYQQRLLSSSLYDPLGDDISSFVLGSRPFPMIPTGALTIVQMEGVGKEVRFSSSSSRQPLAPSSASSSSRSSLKEWTIKFPNLFSYFLFLQELSCLYLPSYNSTESSENENSTGNSSSLTERNSIAKTQAKICTIANATKKDLEDDSNWEDCIIFMDRPSQSISVTSLITSLSSNKYDYHYFLMASFQEILLLAHNNAYLEDIYQLEVTFKRSSLLNYLFQDNEITPQTNNIEKIVVSFQRKDGFWYSSLEISHEEMNDYLVRRNQEDPAQQRGQQDDRGASTDEDEILPEEAEEEDDEERFLFLLPAASGSNGDPSLDLFCNCYVKKSSMLSELESLQIASSKSIFSIGRKKNNKNNQADPQDLSTPPYQPAGSSSSENNVLVSSTTLPLHQILAQSAPSTSSPHGNVGPHPAALMTACERRKNDYLLSFYHSELSSSSLSLSSAISNINFEFDLKIVSFANLLPVDYSKTSDVYYLLFFTDETGRKLVLRSVEGADAHSPSSSNNNTGQANGSGSSNNNGNSHAANSAAALVSSLLSSNSSACEFFRSEVMSKNCSPVFNNVHHISEQVLKKCSSMGDQRAPAFLLLEVWDYNLARPHEPLGEVFIPLIWGAPNALTSSSSSPSSASSPSGGRGETFTGVQKELAVQPTSRMTNVSGFFSTKNTAPLGSVTVQITSSLLRNAHSSGAHRPLSSSPTASHYQSMHIEELIQFPINLSLRELHPTDRLWPVRFLQSNGNFNGQLFYLSLQFDSLVLYPYFPADGSSSSSSLFANLKDPTCLDLLKILNECFENNKSAFDSTEDLLNNQRNLDHLGDFLGLDKRQTSFKGDVNPSAFQRFFKSLAGHPHRTRDHRRGRRGVHRGGDRGGKKKATGKDEKNKKKSEGRGGSVVPSFDVTSKLKKAFLGSNGSGVSQDKPETLEEQLENVRIEIDYESLSIDDLSILSSSTLLLRVTLRRLMDRFSAKGKGTAGVTFTPRVIQYHLVVGPCVAVELYSYITSRMELFTCRKLLKETMIYPQKRSIPLKDIDFLHDLLVKKLHVVNQEIEKYEQEHDLLSSSSSSSSPPSSFSPLAPPFTSSEGMPHPSHRSATFSYRFLSSHGSWGSQESTAAPSMLLVGKPYELNQVHSSRHFSYAFYLSLLAMRLTATFYYEYFLFLSLFVENYWLSSQDDDNTNDRAIDGRQPTFDYFDFPYASPQGIQRLTDEMEEKLRQIQVPANNLEAAAQGNLGEEGNQFTMIANEIVLSLTFHIRMFHLFHHRQRFFAQRYPSAATAALPTPPPAPSPASKSSSEQGPVAWTEELGLSRLHGLVYQQYCKFVVYLKYALETLPAHHQQQQQQQQKQSAKSSELRMTSKFHHNLIIFILSEDLLIERALSPYLAARGLSFFNQPLLSRCIDFKRLIHEFILFLDANIISWNTTAIRRIMRQHHPAHAHAHAHRPSTGGAGYSAKSQQSFGLLTMSAQDRLSLLTAAAAGGERGGMSSSRLRLVEEEELEREEEKKRRGLLFHSRTTSSASSAQHHGHRGHRLNSNVSTGGGFLQDKEVIHSKLFPWPIRLIPIYSTNEFYLLSDIPETIQTMLVVQIGLKKISAISYERLSLANIKRIFIINWKIASAIARCYASLISSYRFYANELVARMLTLSIKTETKFQIFLESIAQRLKALSSNTVQEISFTIQQLTTSAFGSEAADGLLEDEQAVDRYDSQQPAVTAGGGGGGEGGAEEKEKVVDDLLCFLLSIINDCSRIQSALIPETLQTFLAEYATLSNDLLLSPSSSSSSSHTSSFSASWSGQQGKDHAHSPNEPVDVYRRHHRGSSSHSHRPGSMQQPGHLSAQQKRRLSAELLTSEEGFLHGPNIAVKQFHYIFLKPLQLVSSVMEETINHLVNQIFFFSELKDYFLRELEDFILLKSLPRKLRRERMKRRNQRLMTSANLLPALDPTQLASQLKQLPLLLMTPFFHARTQFSLSHQLNRSGSSASEENSTKQGPGKEPALQPEGQPSQKHDPQGDGQPDDDEDEEGEEEVIASPMEVVMATLTEFYNFVGRYVKLPVLYEVIHQCMTKLVMRYLLLVRDMLLIADHKHQQRENRRLLREAGQFVHTGVAVAKEVISTVPQLPLLIGKTIVHAANRLKGTGDEEEEKKDEGEEKEVDEMDILINDEADEEDEEEAISRRKSKKKKRGSQQQQPSHNAHDLPEDLDDEEEHHHLKRAQLEQMREDVKVIIHAHSQITDEKIHSVLRFLSMAVGDIWTSSHSSQTIDQTLADQFKAQPPEFSLHDRRGYHGQLESYLMNCKTFHDFTNEEILQENRKFFCVQLSDLAVISLPRFRLLVLRVRLGEQVLQTKFLSLQQRRSLIVHWDDLLSFSNIQDLEGKELVIELVDARPLNFLTERVYGATVLRFSDLKPFVITEVRHFSGQDDRKAAAVEAINDEMEDFYREYHDSLSLHSSATSAYSAAPAAAPGTTSTGANETRQALSALAQRRASSSSRRTAHRGFSGWFRLSPDLAAARERLQQLHPGAVPDPQQQPQQQQGIGGALFSEEPVVEQEAVPLQLQLRLRVIEFSPMQQQQP